MQKKSNLERFMKYVSIPDSITELAAADNCWLWLGAKYKGNYGQFRFGNKGMGAHRASWLLFKGLIPEGLDVLHNCDNPSCVNPNHLWTGNDKDNVDDKVKKGRQAKGDSSGSIKHPEKLVRGVDSKFAKLTEEQVISVRKEHAEGMTQRALGKKYNVTYQTISNIVKYKKWKHVK